MRRARLTMALGALYAAALAGIGLWPHHVDSNYDVVTTPFGQWVGRTLDITPPQTYRLIETSSNVLLFVPLGALVLLMWPRLRWIGAVAVGLVATTAIEIAQAVALPGRTASGGDILANTAGAAVGASLVVVGGVVASAGVDGAARRAERAHDLTTERAPPGSLRVRTSEGARSKTGSCSLLFRRSRPRRTHPGHKPAKEQDPRPDLAPCLSGGDGEI